MKTKYPICEELGEYQSLQNMLYKIAQYISTFCEIKVLYVASRLQYRPEMFPNFPVSPPFFTAKPGWQGKFWIGLEPFIFDRTLDLAILNCGLYPYASAKVELPSEISLWLQTYPYSDVIIKKGFCFKFWEKDWPEMQISNLIDPDPFMYSRSPFLRYYVSEELKKYGYTEKSDALISNSRAEDVSLHRPGETGIP